jgi:UPF0755 protein
MRAWLGVLLALVPPVLALRYVARALARYEHQVMPYLRDAGPVFVEVPPGSSAGEAIRALVGGGVLRDAGASLDLLRRSGRTREIKAGEYRFELPLAPAEVLRRLVAGDVFLRRITLPEGLTRFDLARRFAAEGFGPADDFLAAAAATALIADLDPEASDLEGYLFPETYHLGRKDGAVTLVAQMVARFRDVVGPDAPLRAQALGLTMRQAVTLASLVEKETARAAERQLVAGVYLNRLRRGMLMQADPSVIYGLLLAGRYDGNLTRAHLREPGPYNTYVSPGLPPGPIASPGRAALEAALAPAETDHLYFVSRNDGTHVFSRSLAEHNRAVETFQRKYWREQWRAR